MIMQKTLLLLLYLIPTILMGQTSNNWLSQDLQWRNIGPANMMGRIAAVDALDTDYRYVVCASASGGVFLSKNAGMTWQAIFDGYGPGSIGAVKINQAHPEIIWVGTGEAANRNSSGWGDGIYRTSDGSTFEHMGLENTHHIAEIALHPQDTNIVYAAAMGHLWGNKGDRGLFKTTDGGKSWQKLTNGLPDDGKTGCTEIIMHPTNPDILFAGFYERLRQPYWYESGGKNGGIFKSTDGGKSWRKITKGLAKGASGMIDLSICLKYPDKMVAAYEADENIQEGKPGSGVYKSDDGGETWTFLLKHAVRPFYHGQIEIDPLRPDTIYVVSRGFQLSYDGGKTFQGRSWRTDGGDDHDMWIAPYDSDIMYLCTDQGLRLSIDGGKSVFSFNNMAIGQYYAIGVDMRDPYWVVGGLQDNGLWTGPSNSRERRGIMNMHNTWVGEGDGFHSQVDPQDWRTLYLVNHVGFATRLDLETREHTYITPTPETTLNFGEYFDPNFPDSMIRYTIYPGEHWFFYERADRPLLPAQFRFNWSSPLVLSKQNPHTIYFGGNHLFKSIDRGETWRIISPDLTGNDPERRNPTESGGLTNSVTGGENHFTIITIAESPIDPSVVWVGTDDGQVQVTQDGGVSWTNVRNNIPGIPEEIWVSRVEASAHKPGRCYITLDNHRYDDMKAYVYVTEDYGKTWTDISGNISDKWSTYVIKEDPVNENLLFVGTETRVHTSYDKGKVWHELMSSLPYVAIHDLIIHPRDGDLIAGTHGRSIWILDDISALRQMDASILEKPLHIFSSRMATKWHTINTGRKQPYFQFRGQNPKPGAMIQFYLKEVPSGKALVTVKDPFSNLEVSWEDTAHQGLNRIYWDFKFPLPEEQVNAYKQTLASAVKTLQSKVENPVLREKFIEISTDLSRAETVSKLNDIRSRMVKDFAGYAGGKPLFGKKMTLITAPTGKYEVNVQIGNLKEVGVVEVRDDPLR